jgi:hypothetical protein
MFAAISSLAPEILQVKVVGILSQIARAEGEIALNKVSFCLFRKLVIG